jgi:hypothetical protein
VKDFSYVLVDYLCVAFAEENIISPLQKKIERRREKPMVSYA